MNELIAIVKCRFPKIIQNFLRWTFYNSVSVDVYCGVVPMKGSGENTNMRFMQTRAAIANFDFSTHLSTPPTGTALTFLAIVFSFLSISRNLAAFAPADHSHGTLHRTLKHLNRSALAKPNSTMATPTTTPNATLHPRGSSTPSPSSNPLPTLLHTPAGLALLELQGTINLPDPVEVINIGRVDFPDYKPDAITFDPASTAWMRRVYLFVGQHQRLTGEVKKLPRAVAVVKRRDGEGEEGKDELEVVEIVKYKLVFSLRPEPVGTG